MAIFLLTQSYRSTKDDIQKDACLICLCFYWDPWWMQHPGTVKQDRQHGVCIYNMYCTHFTVNTSEVHSHISITCSNSMRILLGWGQVAEAFKLCRELWDNQQESCAPASQVKAAVCCSHTVEGVELGVEKAEQALSSGERRLWDRMWLLLSTGRSKLIRWGLGFFHFSI